MKKVFLLLSLLLAYSLFAIQPAQAQIDIAILHAEQDLSWPTDVRSKLQAFADFGTIDIISVESGTPTLDTLLPYSAVLLTTDFPPMNPTLLGDVLADYVDLGGGVVLMHASMSDPWGLQGRFRTGGYGLIGFYNGQRSGPASLGTIVEPDHPLMEGVSTFMGGGYGGRPATSTIAQGTLVASWSDGTPLLVAGDVGGVPRADIGFFPTSSDIRPDFWDRNTDGAQMMRNGLVFVGVAPLSKRLPVNVNKTPSEPVVPSSNKGILPATAY
jgi:hypothetical protein